MDLRINPKTCVVFDLDDTLYLEVDFLKSAFRFIANELFIEDNLIIYNEMYSVYLNNGNVFEHLIKKYPEKKLVLNNLLKLYRDHIPEINLISGAFTLLQNISQKNGKIGLITDGRSRTQRNKITALGINSFFNDIIISEEFGSEKPTEANYRFFMEKYPDYVYVYIGDNVKKDFISPKNLGWLCIGILNLELGIQKNSHNNLSNEYQPHIYIKTIEEINII
jgi:putative hydrolase of the HAD superfamily